MDFSLVSTVLRAVLKWWWLIIVSTALGIGIGYFVRVDQPNIYGAKATVLIGQDPRFVGTTTGGGNSSGNNTLLAAYSVFARRPSVLQPVIDELALGITADILAERIELQPNPGASLLEIIFYDTEPARAAVVANRIALELVNQSVRSGTTQNVDFVQRQLTDLESQITTLQDQYNSLVAEASTLTSAFDLNQNRAEQTQIDTLLQDLRATYAGLNASLGNVQGQVTLFEEAQPNYSAVASNGAIDLIFAGVAGLVLSILTIVMITFFDDRLQWQEHDFDTVHGQRVLGPLGIIPRNKLPLYSVEMPGSIEVEALRQIRDKLFLSGDTRPQVLCFVSYDSGDGKTLTTSNMAVIFAHSGLRTIVLDLDLRKGDLHEVFRLPNIMGVSDLLALGDPLEEILQDAVLKTDIENLSVLTAGRSNTDPSSLLSRSRFPQLIYLLRQQYDVVVMDSVPTIAGSDSLFLAEVSDGVVIVTSARRTTASALKRTLVSLNEAQGINIMGVIFNRVRLQVTSKYNSPYYHPSATLKRIQQSQEIAKPAASRLNFRAPVITAKDGEVLYSFATAANHLGVRRRTIKKWARSGYLKTERYFFRRWVRESEIQSLLKRQPSQDKENAPAPKIQRASHMPQVTAGQTGELSRVPDQLREQRAALLDFVNKPEQPDLDNLNSNSNSHE